jgi:hypothetical protein
MARPPRCDEHTSKKAASVDPLRCAPVRAGTLVVIVLSA